MLSSDGSRSALFFRLCLFLAVVLNLALLCASSNLSQNHRKSNVERNTTEEGSLGQRILMSFKETANGGNMTIECSRSGPCVPCAYSEKNDEKYRCSETGYRIPLKCVEIKVDSKEMADQKTEKSRSLLENNRHHLKEGLHVDGDSLLMKEDIISLTRHRSLLDNSSTSEGGTGSYITYLSCIPPAYEVKLSVLGFEGIVLFLLMVSGSVVYFKKRRAVTMSGVAQRIPTNPRF